MEDLKLKSSAFEEGGSIPSKYTCDGENTNPPLSISGVTKEAKSLVLIMDDPDVPRYIREDGMWDHWIVFNIPTSITEISEGEEPEGIHGEGTSGNMKYHGPCPPDKEHRYIFQLYALDTELDLREGAGKEVVKSAMKGHILKKAELIGVYNRN
ncbi:MAG: YbhB/YbcL family Raf kinase inhibitor-like protein [Candidatus Pacebacteria bacterium]|nr:YbhB/YbcL family Raf kinase inhibitor-like protein [bacterium]MDP6527434.1 YbhB/YbcL family Raf kinase inhibitor-like protein [Candidatus Paceibacterota bacterium]MDP6659660.1 YbhB/YbcL family Raf kinase inhibitor-like protein [Candidatus Paceibacterota bacterium]